MSHYSAMPKGEYPEPRATIPDSEHRVLGSYLIRPVWLEDYDRGYNPAVQDIYEPGYLSKGDGSVEILWVWTRRERIYVRPLHYDRDGKSYRCEECEAYWSRYPSRKTEVLKEREGWFIKQLEAQVAAMEARNAKAP